MLAAAAPPAVTATATAAPAPAKGILAHFAGTGVAGSTADGGPALQARLDNPFGVVRGPDAALWVADYAAHVVRRISKDGVIATVVGNGKAGYTGDGGPALAASLNHPHELRFDRDGNLFIADTSNHAIRRWDAKTRVLTTFAGSGKPGYAGDGGPASSAELNLPISLQFNRHGDLFIAEIGNHVLRRVDAKHGVISTFAGTGRPGPAPDGSRIAGTPLNGPRSLDFDGADNLWLVMREGNQVLRLDAATGLIRHVAGTGKRGFTGHGGPATEAALSGPKGIAIAPGGDVYLADTENHSILRLDAKRGTLELVAGTGKSGDGPEGDPRKAHLARPHGVFVDADGTVFIGDSENHRIWMLHP